MPTEPNEQKHREKIPLDEDPRDADWFAACVARSASEREVTTNKAAKASLDKEWDKLRDQKCWDEGSVREWSEVAALAKRMGRKAHVGRIFDICVEKYAELPDGDPRRKYKGRCFSRQQCQG